MTTATATPSASFLSTRLPGGWTAIARGADPADPTAKAFEELQRFLSEILRCEQLVVLSGLGTSLGVKGAPSMRQLWDACETDVHAAMKNAHSRGTYFNARIRNRYPYARLPEEKPRTAS